MTNPFKAPEIATIHGALDDAAFTDGAPLSAHVARTLIRNGNRLAARGHLVFRHVAPGAVSPEATVYAGLAYAPSYWTKALPLVHPFPVEKAQGLTKLRMKIRADITTDAIVDFALCTSAYGRRSPFDITSTGLLNMVGTGVPAPYTQADVACRKGDGEELGLYIKAQGHSDDPQLDFTTYGGVASGLATVRGTDYFFRLGSQWNTSGSNGTASPQNLAEAGHRVAFYTNILGGGRLLHSAQIVGVGEPTGAGRTDALFFWPPVATPSQIDQSRFVIYKSPDLQILSVAIYAQDRTEL